MPFSLPFWVPKRKWGMGAKPRIHRHRNQKKKAKNSQVPDFFDSLNPRLKGEEFRCVEKFGGCWFFAFLFWFLSWCIRGVAPYPTSFLDPKKEAKKEFAAAPLQSVEKVRCLLSFFGFRLGVFGACPHSPLPFWCPKRKRKKHQRLRRLLLFCLKLWFFDSLRQLRRFLNFLFNGFSTN